MARGVMALPLGDADQVVTGARVGFYQDWLARMDDDAFWSPVEFDRHLSSLTVPVTMVTGWYDMFLPAQLDDYQALRAAGRDVRLTVGPWKHTDPGAAGEALRDALDWFGTHLLDGHGDRSQRSPRSAVRQRCAAVARGGGVATAGTERPLASAPRRRPSPASPGDLGSGSIPLRPVGADTVGRGHAARPHRRTA